MRALRTFAAALALAAAVPGPAEAQWPSGLIAYSRGGTVYVAAADGTRELAYAEGEWPSIHSFYKTPWIAWVARRGGDRVLLRARLNANAAPLDPVTLPPGDGRVRIDWNHKDDLAVVVEHEGTYEAGVVRAESSAWSPIDGVTGPVAVWHDSRVAIATEEGPVLYDPDDGSVDPVAGAREGDVPVVETSSTVLVVNGSGGAARVNRVERTRTVYLAGATVWDELRYGVLYTRGGEIGSAALTKGHRPFATLPGDMRVLAATTSREPLVELADADGDVAIYLAPLPSDHGYHPVEEDHVPTYGVVEPVPAVRKIADGAGLTANPSLEIARVVPAGRPAAVVATTKPPVPHGSPSTPEPASRRWLLTAALLTAAAVGGGTVAARR